MHQRSSPPVQARAFSQPSDPRFVTLPSHPPKKPRHLSNMIVGEYVIQERKVVAECTERGISRDRYESYHSIHPSSRFFGERTAIRGVQLIQSDSGVHQVPLPFRSQEPPLPWALASVALARGVSRTTTNWRLTCGFKWLRLPCSSFPGSFMITVRGYSE